MADLQAMFQNIGPTSAALMNGIQQGQAFNANESEQAMRQAQMNKIMQETSQAELMNPLELKAKQQAVDAGALKAKQEQDAYRDEILGKAIPQIANVKGPARYAAVDQIFAKAGMPLDDADRQHLFSMDPDAMLKELKDKHEWAMTQNKQYRQAYDVAEMQRKSAEKIAAGHDATTLKAAQARADAIAARKQGTSNIDEQVKSGKMSAEKGAVAYYGAAMVEADPIEKERLLRMASSYEQLAMNLKNAGAAGKVDVGAAANLPTQTITPALGTPPAATPAAGGHSLADVQKMYPGVGVDQLRKAYKDKFGVDLK